VETSTGSLSADATTGSQDKRSVRGIFSAAVMLINICIEWRHCLPMDQLRNSKAAKKVCVFSNYGKQVGCYEEKKPKRHCDTWERDWRGKNSWVHELKAGFQSCMFGFWRSMET
jgi:hypothetical protein